MTFNELIGTVGIIILMVIVSVGLALRQEYKENKRDQANRQLREIGRMK